MPRALILMLLVSSLLGGCVTQSPVSIAAAQPEIQQYPSVSEWLDLQHDVEHLSTDQAVARLVKVGKPDSVGQWFHYGLLNQQLASYGAWTHARDAFQKVQETEALDFEQKQLAGILRQYNQNRINWYLRQSDLLNEQAELQLALRTAREEKGLLEQKIQALTDLEAVISTRREE
ncbi:MAG: hypothetical protein ACI9JM_000018 [Halioglobus sp.]|jgi:hypothetical protein